MTCPYLEYRDAANGRSFDAARAYCTAADRFVQPMRADICNDRYGLEHDRDCEIYRTREGEESVPPERDVESDADESEGSRTDGADGAGDA